MYSISNINEKISDKFVDIIVGGTEKFDPSALSDIYYAWQIAKDGGAVAAELENAVIDKFIIKDALPYIRRMRETVAALARSKVCEKLFDERQSSDNKIEYCGAAAALSDIAACVRQCPDALPDVSVSVTLVRHGEDEQDKVGGWSDNRLTENGIAQATVTAEALAAQKFDAIISSDLRRARETAEIIAARTGHKVIYDAGFRETNNGDYKNLTRAEFAARGLKIYTSLGMDEKYPNGESPDEFYARVRDAFIALIQKYDGKRIMLVTHGGVIAVIRCLVYGYKYTNGKKSVPRHAAATEVKIIKN